MNLLDRYGLRERFTIAGYQPVEKVVKLIDQSHVLVHLPNYQDPLPGAILEAMARSRLVVAFDSGGIREEFENKKTGILIPQGNIEAVAESLSQMYGHQESRHLMGSAARESVLKEFSEKRYRSELENLYRKVLSSSSI